jgi:hypothetical protein
MKSTFVLIMTVVVAAVSATSAFAQAPLPTVPAAAPSLPPGELDRIVSPIALYPDPLLAQVLAASSYSSEIPEASRWADDHQAFTEARLGEAITDDQPPWDPSVQALLPFPSVLRMMAGDMAWTEELGNAVLVQRADVMDAVQRRRRQAWTYGYLRSNAQVSVTDGSAIDVLPVDPAFIPVPYYDPLIVFAPPRRGIVVASAINFRPGVRLGVMFGPWGWEGARLLWPTHTVIINHVPWSRTWANRQTYVHPFAVPRYAGVHPLERHRTLRREEHARRR